MHMGWSAEFLATIGSWKGPIPRLPREPISKMRNPFDRRKARAKD